MTANYMFLTGSQLDTIQAAKRDILSLSERLQRLEAMTAQEDTKTDPERLTACKGSRGDRFQGDRVTVLRSRG